MRTSVMFYLPKGSKSYGLGSSLRAYWNYYATLYWRPTQADQWRPITGHENWKRNLMYLYKVRHPKVRKGVLKGSPFRSIVVSTDYKVFRNIYLNMPD